MPLTPAPTPCGTPAAWSFEFVDSSKGSITRNNAPRVMPAEAAATERDEKKEEASFAPTANVFQPASVLGTMRRMSLASNQESLRVEMRDDEVEGWFSLSSLSLLCLGLRGDSSADAVACPPLLDPDAGGLEPASERLADGRLGATPALPTGIAVALAAAEA